MDIKKHCEEQMKKHGTSSSIWLEHKIIYDIIVENENLKEQIKKLRNCENCGIVKWVMGFGTCAMKLNECKNYSEWTGEKCL